MPPRPRRVGGTGARAASRGHAPLRQFAGPRRHLSYLQAVCIIASPSAIGMRGSPLGGAPPGPEKTTHSPSTMPFVRSSRYSKHKPLLAPEHVPEHSVGTGYHPCRASPKPVASRCVRRPGPFEAFEFSKMSVQKNTHRFGHSYLILHDIILARGLNISSLGASEGGYQT